MAAGRLLTLLLILTAAAGCERIKEIPGTERIMLAGRAFTLEVADDEPRRSRGLGGRESIPADGGMLFIFPAAAVRSFWMRDCLVDIDIMFLDPRGRITAVHRMTPEPPRRDDETEAAYLGRLRSYASLYPAQFVIELQAGSLDALGLRVDQKVELDLARLKALAR